MEELIREQEREAYAALMRAVYSNPRITADPFVSDEFLSQAKVLLSITPEVHRACLDAVKPEVEMIKRGQRPPGRAAPAAPYGTPGSFPAGQPPPADRQGALQPAAADQGAVSVSVAPSENTTTRGPGRSKGRGKRAKDATRAIGAPGSSRGRGRPTSGPRVSSGLGRHASMTARPRSTRSTGGAVDPNGYIGHRIWRFYPEEDPERPWVEGFLSDYDPITGTYTILYNPNDPAAVESVEEGFDFSTISPDVYVLGAYQDLAVQFGSRRMGQRPEPMPLGLAPTAPSAPNKRRRSSAVKIPAQVPFPQGWLQSAVLEANLEDLRQMLAQLDAREGQILAQLSEDDVGPVTAEDLKKRVELERKLQELCRREEEVWREWKALDDALKGEP